MMRFAAQIACWTSAGASAGAAAWPFGSSFAFVPATSLDVSGVRSAELLAADDRLLGDGRRARRRRREG